MRALAILTLLVAFVAAVVLPHNEVGTHDLPALSGKVIAKVHGKTIQPPAKAIACLVAVEAHADAIFSVCESGAWRSMRTAGNAQLNLPLLI